MQTLFRNFPFFSRRILNKHFMVCGQPRLWCTSFAVIETKCCRTCVLKTVPEGFPIIFLCHSTFSAFQKSQPRVIGQKLRSIPGAAARNSVGCNRDCPYSFIAPRESLCRSKFLFFFPNCYRQKRQSGAALQCGLLQSLLAKKTNMLALKTNGVGQ